MPESSAWKKARFRAFSDTGEGMAGKERGTGVPKALAIVGAIAALASVLALITAQQMGDFGTLAGKVSIGPLCPVEPCHENTDIYASRKVVATPDILFGGPSYADIGPDGAYSARLRAGAYHVTVTDCDFLGCRRLPLQTEVLPGKTTALDIEIDTGIR